MSSVALTLDDLPAGFEAMSAGELRDAEAAFPDGSDAVGFMNNQRMQFIMSALIPYKSEVEQTMFDRAQQDLIEGIASALGAGQDTRPLDGLVDIGETRAGITALSDLLAIEFRWDIVAFRRGDAGVLIYTGYPDGDEPAITIEDLTRLQDERIRGGPSAGGSSGSTSGGRDTLKIGLISPLTGPVPTFGQSVLEGVELAVEEWNAAGGVLGLQIELVVADGQCLAESAVNAANKLINQDGVKFIIGEVCSSASIPVAEIANQKKVLQISPTSTNISVTVDANGKTRPFYFRACFIDAFQGQVMARFAQDQGYQTAYILYDPGVDYSVDLAEAFEETFTGLGGQIVGKQTHRSNETDFSEFLTRVAESNAEVLYLPDYYNVVNLIGAQAKEMDLSAVLMGGDGWDSADLDLSAADGGFYSSHYDPNDTRPVVMEWNERYGAVYEDANGDPKVPDALATLGYDAANLLFAAIDEAGVDDTAQVAEALAGLTWEGVSGTITFDAQHNPIKNVVVIGISGGEKVFVESVSP